MYCDVQHGMVFLTEMTSYVSFSCLLVGSGRLVPVASMFYILKVFLETLSDGVGGLAHILFSTFFAGDGIDEVIEFTGEVLGYNVSAFGSLATDGSTVVKELAISAMVTLA